MFVLYFFIIYFIIGIILFKTTEHESEIENLLSKLNNSQYILVTILCGFFWLPVAIIVFLDLIKTGKIQEIINNEEDKKDNNDK